MDRTLIVYVVNKDVSLHELRMVLDGPPSVISREGSNSGIESIRRFSRGPDTLEITFVHPSACNVFLGRCFPDSRTGLLGNNFIKHVERKKHDILTLPNGDEIIATPDILAQVNEVDKLKARVAELEAQLGELPVKKKPRLNSDS